MSHSNALRFIQWIHSELFLHSLDNGGKMRLRFECLQSLKIVLMFLIITVSISSLLIYDIGMVISNRMVIISTVNSLLNLLCHRYWSEVYYWKRHKEKRKGKSRIKSSTHNLLIMRQMLNHCAVNTAVVNIADQDFSLTIEHISSIRISQVKEFRVWIALGWQWLVQLTRSRMQ